MAVKLAPHVPKMASDDGVVDAAKKALGKLLLDVTEHVGEITLTVQRDGVLDALRALRDTPGLEYQQVMEISGVDYPERPERFELNYHLLSLTRNRRIRVKVLTDETTPVASATALWPVANWLEREAFDMYGILFAGHPDLRRILTDYGFEGYPQRKDFPLTGHVELRYSEAEKRVIYEPVDLPQDFRTFDFLMPWQNAEYVLPGDEKAAPASTSATPKTTEKTADTGAGKPADAEAKKQARKPAKAKAASEVSKSSPAQAGAQEAKPKAARAAPGSRPVPGNKKGDA